MRVQLIIPDDLLQEVDKVCAKRHTNRSQFFRDAAHWSLTWDETPPMVNKKPKKEVTVPDLEKKLEKIETETSTTGNIAEPIPAEVAPTPELPYEPEIMDVEPETKCEHDYNYGECPYGCVKPI